MYELCSREKENANNQYQDSINRLQEDSKKKQEHHANKSKTGLIPRKTFDQKQI